MNENLNIAVVGYGNVGWSLVQALSKIGANKISVVSNSTNEINGAGESVQCVNDISELSNVDLAILCVSDSLVDSKIEAVKEHCRYFAHTSGSVSMKENDSKAGVFYPFQTFTKGRELDWKAIPICLEANDEKLLELLRDIGKSLSNNVVDMNSDTRKRLHLVGVFAANFNNHLRQRIDQLLAQANLPSSIAEPLLDETNKKALELGASKSQTGPAVRRDQATIEQHLKMLENDDELYRLYHTFTQSIQATNS